MTSRSVRIACATLLFFGCEALGGGGLPPPEEGSRLLAGESIGPVSLDFRDDGYLESVRVEIPVTGDTATAATDVVARHGALFGLDRGSYETSVHGVRDVDGAEIVDLDVSLDGVPIEGGAIVVVVQGGAVRYMGSGLPFPQEVSTTPTVAADDAVAVLTTLYGAAPAAGAPELVLVDPGSLTGGASSGTELAWRVVVTAPERERAYVSAADARVILRAPTAYTADLSRTIRDAAGSTDWETTAASAPVVADDTGVTTPSVDTDALYEQLATSYAYFEDTFRWSSHDDMCAPLSAVVDFGFPDPDMPMERVDNAAWWNGSLYFSAGMTTPDITQHELTHAVLESVGNDALVYQGEAGALNEHLADAFAAFLDSSADRWDIGEGSASGVLRSMAQPSTYGQPDHREDFVIETAGACGDRDDCMDGDYCRNGSCVCLREECDYGHVHTNSGILNHALYLLVAGGEHASRGGRPVERLGLEKAQDLYFEAMYLLHANTSLRWWRNLLIQACLMTVESGRVHGRGSAIQRRDCGRIFEAFDRVGYGPGDRDLDTIHDEIDNCPNEYNPEQDPEAECTTATARHCRGARYERAYEIYREGLDIGQERSHADALLVTARCAISARDLLTARQLGLAAAGATGAGGRADGFYIAEWAAERLGRTSEAEGYREQGLDAGAESGMCSGGTEEDRRGCAGFQRSGTRSGLESLYAGE